MSGFILGSYIHLLSFVDSNFSAAVTYFTISMFSSEQRCMANVAKLTVLKLARVILPLTNVTVSFCGQINIFLWPFTKLICRIDIIFFCFRLLNSKNLVNRHNSYNFIYLKCLIAQQHNHCFAGLKPCV